MQTQVVVRVLALENWLLHRDIFTSNTFCSTHFLPFESNNQKPKSASGLRRVDTQTSRCYSPVKLSLFACVLILSFVLQKAICSFFIFVAAEQHSRIHFLKPQSSSCHKQHNESLVQLDLVWNGSFPRVVITVCRRGWMGDNHLLLAEGERGGGASKTAGWNGGGGHGKRGEEAKRFMKEFCQSELGGLNIPTFCSPATLLCFLSLDDTSKSALRFYPSCIVTFFTCLFSQHSLDSPLSSVDSAFISGAVTVFPGLSRGL